MARLVIATQSFWTEHEGEDRLFLAGVSKLPADHPVAKRAAAYFEPLDEPPPQRPAVEPAAAAVEDASAEPGRKRGEPRHT